MLLCHLVMLIVFHHHVHCLLSLPFRPCFQLDHESLISLFFTISFLTNMVSAAPACTACVTSFFPYATVLELLPISSSTSTCNLISLAILPSVAIFSIIPFLSTSAMPNGPLHLYFQEVIFWPCLDCSGLDNRRNHPLKIQDQCYLLWPVPL